MSGRLKLLRIVTGWFRSKVWASEQIQRLSRERLRECTGCDDAIESSALKFINGDAEQVKCQKCRHCGCPIVEKSLVENETCPLKKWKN
jgi:hypothetical protein